MTAKERAKYLIHEYHTHLFQGKNDNHQFAVSKLAALIGVGEIINEYNRLEAYKFIIEKEYWQEVKQEIEKC